MSGDLRQMLSHKSVPKMRTEILVQAVHILQKTVFNPNRSEQKRSRTKWSSPVRIVYLHITNFPPPTKFISIKHQQPWNVFVFYFTPGWTNDSHSFHIHSYSLRNKHWQIRWTDCLKYIPKYNLWVEKLNSRAIILLSVLMTSLPGLRFPITLSAGMLQRL